MNDEMQSQQDQSGSIDISDEIHNPEPRDEAVHRFSEQLVGWFKDLSPKIANHVAYHAVRIQMTGVHPPFDRQEVMRVAGYAREKGTNPCAYFVDAVRNAFLVRCWKWPFKMPKPQQDQSGWIDRLRDTDVVEQHDNNRRMYTAGIAWARERAELAELKRLRKRLDELPENEDMLARHYSCAQEAYFILRPRSQDGDDVAADEFWERELGQDWEELTSDPDRIQVFLRNALSVLDEYDARTNDSSCSMSTRRKNGDVPLAQEYRREENAQTERRDCGRDRCID